MDLVLALVLSMLAAFLPTAFYVVGAWWLDRYEKEPAWLLSIVFLWGAVPAIIVSIIAELLLDIPIQLLATGQSSDLLSAAVVAPTVEEVAKAIPLLLIFLLFRREFDGLVDGLLYGALVGFGFSMTENVFYFLGAYAEEGWGAWGILVFLRAFVFGLNHALFTSATGVGLAVARNSTRHAIRLLAPLLGLFGAIVLHAIHNFFVSLPEAGLICFVSLVVDWLGVLVWLVLLFVATRKEKEWIAAELAAEVTSGLLPAPHARAASRYRSRLADRWAAFRERGMGQAHRLNRLHVLAAELGLKKRQLRLHGNERGNAEEIARLRCEIAGLLSQIG